MFVEFLIATACLASLLWVTHMSARVTLHLFALADEVESLQGKDGRRRLRLLEAFTRSPQDVVLAADLFHSLAFLAEAVVIVWAIPRWSAQTSLPLLPALVTALILVWIAHTLVSEVLPKSPTATGHGLRKNEGTATLTLVWLVLGPLVAFAQTLSRRHPVTPRTAGEREEIVERALESLSESTGLQEPVIEDDEREMIQGVIGLEHTEVRELMVPRVNIIAIEAGAPVEDVRRLTREWGHSRLPVYDGDLDSIIGILYVKDMFCALQDAGNVNLATLARRAFVVPETKKVDALLEEFKRRKTHIAIVADEFGGTAGLISLEDILEEIVGEIEDEHDRGRSPIERLGNGIIRVDGVVPLREIAEAMETNLPEHKFETIGGLIYDKVGGIPEVGVSIQEFGLTLTIEEMDGQRIRRVRVSRAHSPAGQNS